MADGRESQKHLMGQNPRNAYWSITQEIPDEPIFRNSFGHNLTVD